MIYFKESEFKMGNEIVFDNMQEDFLCLLDDLRLYVKEPLIINSSYRSLEYNEIIQKRVNKDYTPYSSKSKHLTGIAVDLHCTNGALRLKIVHNALDLGLSVGIGKTFIHVDNRSKQIIFTY